MYGVSALADLEPVAERIGHVEPLGAWNRILEGDLAPGGAQTVGQRGEVVGDEARVRLARRSERLLDADVELLGAGPEPAAAPRGERLRLGDLRSPSSPP